jgi:hypothetical protein
MKNYNLILRNPLSYDSTDIEKKIFKYFFENTRNKKT